MTTTKRSTQKIFMYSAFCILHSAFFLVPLCRAQMSQAPGGLNQLRPSFDQQTDVFRRLLIELRFLPLETFAELQENPNESLFIMLGKPSCLSQRNFPEGLRSFVAQGGAVLTATDMETDGEAGENLKKLAGITVTGEKLVVRGAFSNLLYRDSPFCPFIEPLEHAKFPGAVTDLMGAGSKPDLFRHYSSTESSPLQVVTNAPSYLKISSGWWLPLGIHKLARLPRLCQYEEIDPSLNTRSEKYPIVDENGPLFAVGGTIGKGRVIVLADHSIFINRMILPTDNNNLEFAVNCLHWLRGGISTPMEGLRALNSGAEGLKQIAGQRNKVLYWDDDRVHKTFEVPLKMAPLRPALPSEPAIVAAIDKTIAKLEESDSLNHALLEQIDELPGGRKGVIRTAIYLITFAAVAFLGYRFLWRTRHRPELAAVPLLSKVLREHEPNATLLEQRRRALLRSGNLWEVGHCLARDFFESSAVPLTRTAPRVAMVHGGRWQRWRFQRRVARLWRLACGDAAKSFSSTTLRLRMREIEELKTALANGTIRLTGERPA